MLFSALEKKELLFPLHLCPRSRELVWMQGELPRLCQLSYNKLQSSYLGFQLLFQTLADKILTNQCIYGWVKWGQGVLQGQDNLFCWKSTNLLWLLSKDDLQLLIASAKILLGWVSIRKLLSLSPKNDCRILFSYGSDLPLLQILFKGSDQPYSVFQKMHK